MNTLFLVAATVVAFAFGSRFYAKLLALEVFRLDTNYSTRAQSGPDGQDFVPTHRYLLLGHHFAAVTGISAVAAPIVALDWGWIPAFLWITIGSTVAAGTYAVGSFWLSSRFPNELGHLARQLMGIRARVVVRALSLVILLVLVSAAAGFGAALFVEIPSVVPPSAILVVGAWFFGTYLHGRPQSRLLPAAVVSLVAILLLSAWLGGIPIGFGGALTVNIGDHLRFAIDPLITWMVLLLAYAFASAQLPVWKLARPRGFLLAIMTGVALLLFFVALIVQHPTIDAPQFHSPASGTHALPWLFLMVGTGALAGWHLLIVSGVTGRELQREPDARYVGYGVAIIQGLIALSALVLASAAFGDRGSWFSAAGALNVGDFPRAASFYIDRYARLVSVLGLDAATARVFVATVLAGLSLAVLETAVRALMNGLIDIAPPPPAITGRRNGRRRRLWLVVLSAAALALHEGHGFGGVNAWPLLAVASLWFAAAGFALMALALRRAQQPPLIPTVLALAVALLAVWCTAVQVWTWWEAESWIAVAAVTIVTALAAWLLCEAILAARQGPQAPETADET